MKKVFAIAAVNLRRLTRDRIGSFFVFVFPIVLILLLGIAFGGDFTLRLGVVSRAAGDLEQALYRDIADSAGLEVERFSEADALLDAVERGTVESGMVIPMGYDETLRTGGTARVRYLARPGDLSTALRSTVDSAVAEQAALVRAAKFAALQGPADFDLALTRAENVAERVPGVGVKVTSAGGAEPEENVGRFDLGASSQLILFVFVNSLAYSAALIQSRLLGVSRRMLSTPLGAGTVLLGEGLGRFGVAMVQGAFIVVAAGLLFGVDWGDPLAASVLVIAFALVSTGAALLFGAILSNEQQAGALVPLGLALAALGGCMVPLEVFSPTMRTIAHITPHAWAVEGFTELIRRDAGLVDILPQIAALLGFAALLLSVASWRLRKAIVG
jgi:ABC-2 type transport system permease protein